MIAAALDFEKLMLTPFGHISSFYCYKGLGNYNSTVTEFKIMATSCYIRSESKCNKSSCVIVTALQNYLIKKNKESLRHFHFFSNTCGSQNGFFISYII